jgi:hypothetical protein
MDGLVTGAAISILAVSVTKQHVLVPIWNTPGGAVFQSLSGLCPHRPGWLK